MLECSAWSQFGISCQTCVPPKSPRLFLLFFFFLKEKAMCLGRCDSPRAAGCQAGACSLLGSMNFGQPAACVSQCPPVCGSQYLGSPSRAQSRRQGTRRGFQSMGIVSEQNLSVFPSIGHRRQCGEDHFGPKQALLRGGVWSTGFPEGICPFPNPLACLCRHCLGKKS